MLLACLFILASWAAPAGCTQVKATPSYVVGDQTFTPYAFRFSTDADGWTGDFTDYPAGGSEAFYELAWGWDNLPTEIPIDVPPQETAPTLTKGLYLSGNNHSDDLFMFVKRPITGLLPNTLYALNFNVVIESNVPPDTFGVGGSPGEAVYFKVGASAIEPKKVNVNGFYQLSVDKGEQSEGGKNALVIGDIANPAVIPQKPEYLPKQLENQTPLNVRSDANGQLWIFIGTDSGYEGTSKYYIAMIDVLATALSTDDGEL